MMVLYSYTVEVELDPPDSAFSDGGLPRPPHGLPDISPLPEH